MTGDRRGPRKSTLSVLCSTYQDLVQPELQQNTLSQMTAHTTDLSMNDRWQTEMSDCSVSVPGHLQRVNAKETLIRLLDMTDVPAHRLMSMETVDRIV